MSSIVDGVAALAGSPGFEWGALGWLAVAAGGLVLAGLWTPVTGTLMAFAELGLAFASPDHVQRHLLLAAMGAGLAMLGPGAWSFDARLFGRKRVEIPDR